MCNLVCSLVLTGMTMQFLFSPGYQLVFACHCTVEGGEERWVSCMILDPHTFLLPRQTSTS